LEELDIAPDTLRGGRFIHLLADTAKRQSYALSRLTADKLAYLPEGEWVALEATTEFGFRYAILPENSGSSESKVGAAAISIPPTNGRGAAVSIPPTGRGPRPSPVASASASGEDMDASPVHVHSPAEPLPDVPRIAFAPPPPPPPSAHEAKSSTLPPRPVPMEPELARAALRAVPREFLEAALTAESGRVAELHQRVEQLEILLQQHSDRERDLLALLSRWQSAPS